MALRTVFKGERKGKSMPYPVKFGELDNAKNTTVDGKQVWVYFSDSTAITNQGTDTAPEVFYANSVFYWNAAGSNVIAVTNNDIPTKATAGTLMVKLGIDMYKRTGFKPVFVTNNTGGSNFFPDGDTNNTYDYVVQFGDGISDTKNALISLGLTEVRGVFIQKGVNDARAAQDIGAVRYAIFNLVDKINSRLGVPRIHFVNIGRDENGNGRGQRILAVDSAITEVCNHFANCYEVLRMSDYIADPFIYSNSFADVHMTQFGLDFVGAKMCRNMVQMGLLSDTPRPYTYGVNVQPTLGRLPGVIDEEKWAINDFIEYLVSKSEWTANKIDSFYLPLFNDPSNCLQDWVRDKKMTIPGTARVLTNRMGIQTDGTTGGRVMSNYTPSVDKVNYAQNNAMAGVWVFKDDQATGADYYLMGVADATQRISINYNNANSNLRSSINSVSQAIFGVNRQFQRNSLYIATRNSSTNTNIVENYQSSTGAVASIGIPTREVAIGCNDNNGVLGNPGKFRIGPVFFGAASGGPNSYFYKKLRELVIDFIIMRS